MTLSRRRGDPFNTLGGFPRGGILSPLMFNMAFDSFSRQMEGSEEVTTVAGYADDVCLLIQDPKMEGALQKTQTTLDKVLEWSKTHKLEFCPKKSEYIQFAWRRRAPKAGYRFPSLAGAPITKSKSFKYLGLTLTHNLKWRKHINSKIQKAKHLLKRANSAFGT
jgi:hypothetical protein